VRMICSATYFQYNNQLYEQTRGLPMGSPISPLLVDIFMETVEEEILEKAGQTVKQWYRYVDDTLVIMEEAQVEEMLKYMNNMYPHLKFTYEKWQNRTINFLDCLIQVRKDGTVVTSVYRKKTDTRKTLEFTSCHPNHTKFNTTKWYFQCAKAICNDRKQLNQEIQYVREMLRANKYPNRTINRALKTV
uniref:Reverse transcriptase domain-containing protein n=1 Tax=Latimeria chalumnae TaxID=7897 RepID=H2ZRT9_LATCH